MSATDELRGLLDERGVKMFHSGPNVTYFETPYGEAQATEYEPGVFGVMMKDLTPDQAIAATLGGGECEMVTSGIPSEGNTDKRCIACGAYNIGEYYDGLSHIASPRFCPNCGRRVKR